MDAKTATAQAENLMRGCLVWDNHTCMPLNDRAQQTLAQLDGVKAAGVDVLSINAGFGPSSFEDVLTNLVRFTGWIEQHNDTFAIARTIADLEAIVSSGRLAIVFDIEGVACLEGKVHRIGELAALGVRWMLLVYNKNNAAGGGCLDEDAGLTAFGRDCVAALNETGIVPCASHCGPRTAFDIIEASQGPVIFSHSNARALCPHPRNICDDLMAACASKGGVICATGFGPFVGAGKPLVSGFSDHVERMLAIAGEGHVGLGLDYCFDAEDISDLFAANPALFPPANYGPAANMLASSDLKAVSAELLARGHSPTTMRKILGANLVRIAHTAWPKR